MKAAQETVPSSSADREYCRPAGLLGLHDLAADGDQLADELVDLARLSPRQVLLDFDDLEICYALGYQVEITVRLDGVDLDHDVFARDVWPAHVAGMD